MSTPEETTVGKKGEILPKKHIREASGIHAGDKILIEAHYGEIFIQKVFSVGEAFAMPIISTRTADVVERELESEGKRQEELID